jgi:hypothetical protein
MAGRGVPPEMRDDPVLVAAGERKGQRQQRLDDLAREYVTVLIGLGTLQGIPESDLKDLARPSRILAERAHVATLTRGPKIRAVMTEWENELYKLAMRKRGPGGDFPSVYTEVCFHASKLLSQSPGPFPDKFIAQRLFLGEITPKGAADEKLLYAKPEDNRTKCSKMFVGILLRDQRLKNARGKALEFATRIEASCYKVVVTACKSAETPYHRSWDSALFVNLYSERCATVASHLDPAGSVAMAYGTFVIDGMLSGELKLEDIGCMTAAQLCPKATQQERDDIAKRSAQKLKQKWSNIYRCPKPGCGKFQCTTSEQQTRALDEPAKIKCVCVCGHKFEC